MRAARIFRAFSKVVYFDSLATNRLDPAVLQAMMPYQTINFGNPHSKNHKFGWNAEEGVERARKEVATLINATEKEIIFTSGATEANNMAIKGICRFYKTPKKNHVVTLQTEHKCVLQTLRVLEEEGFRVTYLPVDQQGIVDMQAFEDACTEDTIMTSVMAVNNEIGVRQDIRSIGAICKKKGIIFHSDCAQAFGKVPLDVRDMNIDLMSISGHKIYGPKGVGALFIRRKPKIRMHPLISGGGQQRGLRSGTVAPALSVGLGQAAKVARETMQFDKQHITRLQNKLFSALNSWEQIKINGHVKNRVHGCINFSVAGVEGESMMMAIKNYAVSSGSACTSTSLEPSYVLRAMKIEAELAHTSIRVGLNRFTTEREVDEFIKDLKSSIDKLREMSPLWEMMKEGIDIKSIKWAQH